MNLFKSIANAITGKTIESKVEHFFKKTFRDVPEGWTEKELQQIFCQQLVVCKIKDVLKKLCKKGLIGEKKGKYTLNQNQN